MKRRAEAQVGALGNLSPYFEELVIHIYSLLFCSFWKLPVNF
jgi:hypothetical protein